MSAAQRITPSRLAQVKIAALALVAVVLVAGAAYAGYQRTAAQAADSSIATATVTRGDVQSSVPADGRVVVDEWELAFGASGRVASVDVSQGESVTAGQVLARLDDAKARAQLAQARTALASAASKLDGLRSQPISEDVAAKQAVVDAAASALDRAEDAYALLVAESRDTTVSAGELQAKAGAVEAAEDQLAIAQANLAAVKVSATRSEIAAAEAAVTDAQAGLRAAESGLDDYVITAPADGVAVALELVEGQAPPSGTGSAPAIVVADVSKPRVDGQLDEADAASVRTDMPVDIVIDGLGGMTVAGRVERVSAVAKVDQNGLATFDIEVSVDEPVEGLAAGMAVRLQIITDRAQDVLTIPTAVVKRSDGASVVTVVDESGAMKTVTVELGKTDGKTVEVKSGLAEGQKIALESTAKEE
ncbi:MAG: HlyD family efflux transporter periplasmic adaptor subunit [Coriobacteriia bacterium]|nr:HlyD family efflux transporter periplasmic adaptor subunit [Coriobacteriia bacterium]